MGKKLSEMSMEELWRLFPVFLTEPQAFWKEWYAQEAFFLKRVLPQGVKISHIGSTAIGSIWAKPIVDILVEIQKESELSNYKDRLVNNGYICMAQSARGISLNKGYAEDGFADKVFHLHVRYTGDNDELYFRDYLMEHPNAASEYEKLKLKLWKRYEHNRDAYTNAKTEFVHKCTEKARLLYGDRYK